MREKRASGFSLVELVIVIVIIGVIAAIAIPRVTQAGKGAGESALASNLSLLRSAIELYAAEHDGVYPGMNSAGSFGDPLSPEAFKAQLTMYSNPSGDCSATKKPTHQLGPYLAKDIPPLTVGENKNSNTVDVKSDGTALTPNVSGGFGWIYDCESGEIIANSEFTSASGKPYKQF